MTALLSLACGRARGRSVLVWRGWSGCRGRYILCRQAGIKIKKGRDEAAIVNQSELCLFVTEAIQCLTDLVVIHNSRCRDRASMSSNWNE